MRICIIGGGTAGWMTASYLSTQTDHEITLVESEVIPIIGVGESTVPSFTTFVETIGVSEQELFDIGSIRKYASRHCDWPEKGNKWFHHFIFDEKDEEEQLTWMQNRELPDKHWRHSYHIDAHKFSKLVSEKFSAKIHKHSIDTVVNVECDDNGISKVIGKKETYTADLFIDCSGLRQLLLKNFTNTVRNNKNVINNRAWAGHADYTHDATQIDYTRTFAMNSGWQWNICLRDRVGCGYVFNDKFISDEDAKQEFIENCPFDLREDSLRLIEFESKWNTNPWTKNVVAIGLSAGFLEPLESQSIFLTQMQIQSMYRLLDKHNNKKVFNKFWNMMIDHIAEYLELHYTLSNRTDTAYWRSFPKTKTVTYSHTYSPLFHAYGYRAIANAYGAKVIG